MATDEERALILLKETKQNTVTLIQIGYAICERLDSILVWIPGCLAAALATLLLIELWSRL